MPWPADLRYREDLLFPGRTIKEAGNVRLGRPLQKIFKGRSKLEQAREMFPKEKFLINCDGELTDMVLEHGASGEDALRGWLVAAFIEKRAFGEAYGQMEAVFPSFISEVKARGWHTDRFLDGRGCRFSF